MSFLPAGGRSFGGLQVSPKAGRCSAVPHQQAQLLAAPFFLAGDQCWVFLGEGALPATSSCCPPDLPALLQISGLRERTQIPDGQPGTDPRTEPDPTLLPRDVSGWQRAAGVLLGARAQPRRSRGHTGSESQRVWGCPEPRGAVPELGCERVAPSPKPPIKDFSAELCLLLLCAPPGAELCWGSPQAGSGWPWGCPAAIWGFGI